jgi:CRP-like cAMP-binding protein
MTNPSEKSYPKPLKYKQGDLIMKEGDYGISLYRILSGKAKIFKEVRNEEILLAEVGEDAVLGETSFLHRDHEPLPMSVRALEDCELEVWHLSRIRDEYKNASPLLQQILNTTLIRLMRMNKAFDKISPKLQRPAEKKEKIANGKKPAATQRLYFRKKLDVQCTYRPLNSPSMRLDGQIRDVSLGGIGIEIDAKNLANAPHEPGKIFYVDTVLPNGKGMHGAAKIVRLEKDGQNPDRYWLGMEYTHMSEEDNRNLGIFLMP